MSRSQQYTRLAKFLDALRLKIQGTQNRITVMQKYRKGSLVPFKIANQPNPEKPIYQYRGGSMTRMLKAAIRDQAKSLYKARRKYDFADSLDV